MVASESLAKGIERRPASLSVCKKHTPFFLAPTKYLFLFVDAQGPKGAAIARQGCKNHPLPSQLTFFVACRSTHWAIKETTHTRPFPKCEKKDANRLFCFFSGHLFFFARSFFCGRVATGRRFRVWFACPFSPKSLRATAKAPFLLFV
nr:hypothetical protein [Pandoravirus belohorizontensis]